jgi:dienelactone hydrolase
MQVRILVTIAALLAIVAGHTWAAVAGCAAVNDDYRPYAQWQDLPAVRDGLVDYLPLTHWYPDPIVVNETTAATDVTVILMHGTNGSPRASNLLDLGDRLAALGFKVVSPTMPWGRKLYFTLNAAGTAWDRHEYFAWDGSMCQAMNYVEHLVAQERAIGRRVLLAGHSMGGRHALIYGALNTTDDIVGIVALAPGGMLPMAQRVLTESAPSRLKAAQLVQAGAGDLIESFEVYNTGGLEPILTTARYYRSYVEPDPDGIPDGLHAPNFDYVFPAITEPVLWLAGSDDDLKDFYERNDLFGRLPANTASEYRVVDGDHLSMLLNASGPVHAWFTAWSSIEPADRDSDGSPDKDDSFPDDPAVAVDTDGDGRADDWNPGCDAECRAASSVVIDDDDDDDGMTDAYEVANGLNPVLDDAGLDRDGDGYSNGAEFAAGTAANDPADNPGRMRVILNLLPMLLDAD